MYVFYWFVSVGKKPLFDWVKTRKERFLFLWYKK